MYEEYYFRVRIANHTEKTVEACEVSRIWRRATFQIAAMSDRNR